MLYAALYCIVFFYTLILLSSASPLTSPDAFILAAAVGESSQNLNIHYLHPITLSTSIKPAPIQNISFAPLNGSKLIFTTDLHGYTVYSASTSRPSLPLLVWFTSDRQQYLSLDLLTTSPRLHWSYPLDDRAGAKSVYLPLSDSYWGVTAVNDIGSGQCIFIVSIYKDIGLAVPGEGKDQPVYQSKTNIGQDTAGVSDVSNDPLNHLIFIAISTSTVQGSIGSLQTFDAFNSSLLYNVNYDTASSFGLHYSTQRKQLYTYRINDGNYQIIAIDQLDYTSGKSINLIPQSSLPNVEFYDDSYYHFFVEETGEWYFLLSQLNQTTYKWTSSLFSVNVDTQRVSGVVELIYPSPEVQVLAVYGAPGMMEKDRVPSYHEVNILQEAN